MLQIKLTLFFAFVINCKVGFSQIVSALPPGFNFVVYDLAFDSSSQSLYACGNFTSLANGIPGTPMNFISKWNGSTWDSLGSGADHYVFRVAIYNSQLIATGYFENIGGIAASGLARWDGNNWHFMGNPSRNGVLCPIKSLYVDDGDLYVGGYFDSIAGIPAQGIARFDGTTWHNFPNINSLTYDIGAITKYNNELYIGGEFDAGIGLKDILKFDGTNWVSVGGGLSGSNSHTNCFNIYQNKLVVAGYFNTNWGDPGNNIAFWDGNNWTQPDNGVLPSNVFDVFIHSNKLYAMGQIIEASGVPVSFIAVWDGISWSSFDNIIFDLPVTSMEAGIDKLYICGGFYTINGDTMMHIAQYDLSTGLIESLNDCFKLFQSKNMIQINSFNCGVISNLKLTDLKGQVIFNNEDARKDLFEIDLAYYVPGVYILSFVIDKKTYAKKILIN